MGSRQHQSLGFGGPGKESKEERVVDTPHPLNILSLSHLGLALGR